MSRSSAPLNVSNLKGMQDCFFSSTGYTIMTSYTIIVSFTLLPLYMFIIYLGLQQWLQQQPAKSISHSDVFTFNMIVMELISYLGLILICIGAQSSILHILNAGIYSFSLNLYGQVFFHLLTCLERYLAVVHPFTYRSLQKEKAARIRNFVIVWVWLACLALLGTVNLTDALVTEVIVYCFIVPFFLIMSLCNLNILLVLKQPRPGDSHCQQADRSRMKSFYTILLIMNILLLRFGWELASFRLNSLIQLQHKQACIILLSTVYTNMPSSLVLPLLFLHRAGKLQCLKAQRG